MGIQLYYLISFAIIIFSILIFIVSFERKMPNAKEVTILSAMTAFAILARIMFFMTPQIKPSAAIIIIIGIGLGKEAGFLSGGIMAFVSDLFFGQGPWTPPQMIAFGILGFLAGVLFNREDFDIKSKKNKILVALYGFFSTFIIYGLIMDTQTLLSTKKEFEKSAALAIYGSGVFFNFVHGASTFLFLWILEVPILKKIKRIRFKYNIFNN